VIEVDAVIICMNVWKRFEIRIRVIWGVFNRFASFAYGTENSFSILQFRPICDMVVLVLDTVFCSIFLQKFVPNN
jgi:hypothetical protein